MSARIGAADARQTTQGPTQAATHAAVDAIRDSVAITSSAPCRGRIDFASRTVVMTMRLGGTMVLQRIALNAYQGVSAALVSAPGAEPTVTLTLRHQDPAYSITLAHGLPVEEAVAVWRGWSDRLSVPQLLQDEAGEDSVVRAMLGAVVVRAAQPRKARPLMGRRPRYAKRRGLR